VTVSALQNGNTNKQKYQVQCRYSK